MKNKLEHCTCVLSQESTYMFYFIFRFNDIVNWCLSNNKKMRKTQYMQHISNAVHLAYTDKHITSTSPQRCQQSVWYYKWGGYFHPTWITLECGSCHFAMNWKVYMIEAAKPICLYTELGFNNSTPAILAGHPFQGWHVACAMHVLH